MVTANGHKILFAISEAFYRVTPNEDTVHVVCELSPNESAHKYAVWTMGSVRKQTFHGHYTNEYDEAIVVALSRSGMAGVVHELLGSSTY